MCLRLYVATAGEQPCFETASLNVTDVKPSCAAVRQWLAFPVVRFVGAHTGCSCGFRHIVTQEPIDYYDGMFAHEEDADDAAEARASLAALLRMLREHVERDGAVELYPVWNGNEAKSPLGTIETRVEALQPQTWFFIERFVYRVTRQPEVGTSSIEK